MANPLSPALARTDYVLGKLKQVRMLDAMRELAARDRGPARLANEVLQYPKSLTGAEEFLGDQGMGLGRYLGAGAESLVFEAIPRTGPDQHVLKIRPGMVDDFELPEGIDGIAPYWSKAQVSPMVAAALQPRADAVMGPGLGLTEAEFDAGRRRLRQSLAARGWDWTDSHVRNVGLMPGGKWAVIDGFIDQIHEPDPFGNYGHGYEHPRLEAFNAAREYGSPRASSLPSTEEAIRMLRMTPEEERAIYKTQ